MQVWGQTTLTLKPPPEQYAISGCAADARLSPHTRRLKMGQAWSPSLLSTCPQQAVPASHLCAGQTPQRWGGVGRRHAHTHLRCHPAVLCKSCSSLSGCTKRGLAQRHFNHAAEVIARASASLHIVVLHRMHSRSHCSC